MTPARFHELTSRYREKTIALAGDFCLDRYLEIDPARHEISIETNLPVHNVTRVRSQPGGAGTILNNLSALGARQINPVGFWGQDPEGHNLAALIHRTPHVNASGFNLTEERLTFTYCKPLLITPSQPPVELNRLDFKNWSPTPPAVEEMLSICLGNAMRDADALILLDQVDVPDTGVVTQRLLRTVRTLQLKLPHCLILADSRRGLHDWPSVSFKMNAAELRALTGLAAEASLDAVRDAALALARTQRQPVFVTLAERGILAADQHGHTAHAPALPVRGPIDIVGAGDAVTANLALALSSGATLAEACALAMAAAHVVIHQLGTTGTATVEQIERAMVGKVS